MFFQEQFKCPFYQPLIFTALKLTSGWRRSHITTLLGLTLCPLIQLVAIVTAFIIMIESERESRETVKVARALHQHIPTTVIDAQQK